MNIMVSTMSCLFSLYHSIIYSIILIFILTILNDNGSNSIFTS